MEEEADNVPALVGWNRHTTGHWGGGGGGEGRRGKGGEGRGGEGRGGILVAVQPQLSSAICW